MSSNIQRTPLSLDQWIMLWTRVVKNKMVVVIKDTAYNGVQERSAHVMWLSSGAAPSFSMMTRISSRNSLHILFLDPSKTRTIESIGPSWNHFVVGALIDIRFLYHSWEATTVSTSQMVSTSSWCFILYSDILRNSLTVVLIALYLRVAFWNFLFRAWLGLRRLGSIVPTMHCTSVWIMDRIVIRKGFLDDFSSFEGVSLPSSLLFRSCTGSTFHFGHRHYSALALPPWIIQRFYWDTRNFRCRIDLLFFCCWFGCWGSGLDFLSSEKFQNS